MRKFNGWNNNKTPIFVVGGKHIPISDRIESIVKEEFKPKKTFLEWVKEDIKQKVRNRIIANFGNKHDGLWISDPAKLGYEVIYPDKKKSGWDKIESSLATWIPNAPFKVSGSHTLSKEHRAYLIVDRVENIVGRGKVLIIDLIKNKLTEDKYIDEIPFKKGDSITTDVGAFVIRAIESKAELMGGKISSTIGIVV